MQVDMQTIYNSSSLYALNKSKINYKYVFICEKLRIFYITVVCEACYVDIKTQHSKIDLLEVSWTQRE